MIVEYYYCYYLWTTLIKHMQKDKDNLKLALKKGYNKLSHMIFKILPSKANNLENKYYQI